MTIDGLLDTYRHVFAMSETEKGERFERLMKNFLLIYPVWRGKISEVWRWKESPLYEELGSKDLGIDLVIQTVDGEFWAVQCKLYAETSVVAKKDVDSFFSNATRSFFNGKKFSSFVWISTTDNYTNNALEMFKGRDVKIIDMSLLRRVQVNWILLDNGFKRDDVLIIRKLRDYQIEALNEAKKYYENHDRGKLIMACGTGKTFTALKIAEAVAPNGKILFLVPSISLLSQTLEEWSSDSIKPLNALCVCSDATAAQDVDEIAEVNLPIPPTTDSNLIKQHLATADGQTMTVIFSTYQSLDKVADAHETFDLIICDEAHRTTGSSKDKATHFTNVHDENFIHARRRMYMTATPRMFSSAAKIKAAYDELILWSMDDTAIYGEEFYRLNFGEAVEKKLLSDYKVIVLTINGKKSADKKFANDDAKVIGTINALAKNMTYGSDALTKVDPAPMHTAVAFCQKISHSEDIAKKFNLVGKDKSNIINAKAFHVDGTMSANLRGKKISKLKSTSLSGNTCCILTNVRCLSEGVDVPALDAVIFMASKKSQVEIVQAVGRVMRRAPDKKYGYVIIPVIVPLEKEPEEALARDPDYNVIWDVLNAMRSHDSRIDIIIEEIRLKLASGKKISNKTDGHILFCGDMEDEGDIQTTLNFYDWQHTLSARMVQRVGNRRYWEQWAADIADIAQRHIDRISELISVEGDNRREFYNFVDDLQKILNPSITPDNAIEMLSQHIVTRPVFEALFDNNSFVKRNAVSKALEKVLERFDTKDSDEEAKRLKRFGKSVGERCSIAGKPEYRQQVIIELYERFFKIAVPKTVDKLGIVYTPVEVVDFILRSVDAVLRKNFNRGLTDKGVNILDPFTGTGTFIVRLLQSGLIKPKDLQRKFTKELHANEILLLSYYIAAINIENTFQDVAALNDFCPFNGICFTDTFQAYEGIDTRDVEIIKKGFYVLDENFKVVQEQIKKNIQVIVGNPPYSVGQKSANDNNKNEFYPNLEERIENTYARATDATNKNSLYDSYIKAFRWASDHICNSGVIGFVTNAGWLDGAAMDGLRRCFAKEFSEIYIFNLRGDARTQGELRRKESGNVFGSGSRAPIAITILVKNPDMKPDIQGGAKIFYRDIGNYLTREDKLNIINSTPDVLDDSFTEIIPNEKADWINQRVDTFEKFIPLTPEKKFNVEAKSFFMTYSRGIATARDAWIYNFSRPALESNMQTTIDYYNTHEPTDIDPTKIVWIFDTVQDKKNKLKYEFNDAQIVESMYRPFCKSNFYYDEYLNQRRYQMPKLFPTGREENLLICVTLADEGKFSALIVDKICDLHFNGDTQCFPLYWYEEDKQQRLFEPSYKKWDAVTDWIWTDAQLLHGKQVTKEDIFYYVYGFLHLPSYREKFSNELKKSLPRIILVKDTKKFWQLSKAGRALAEIHLNYETQPPAQVTVTGIEHGDFAVKKLKLSKNKTTLIYNDHITISDIPPRSFDYVVNGRSPLEWIIDRYQIKTDKASGIVNDANSWGIEHDNPRYILDLILSCITVSLKTLEIVENLPDVEFET